MLKEAVKENETELKEVEDALALPMMITSGFESGSEEDAGSGRDVKTTDSERNADRRYDSI